MAESYVQQLYTLYKLYSQVEPPGAQATEQHRMQRSSPCRPTTDSRQFALKLSRDTLQTVSRHSRAFTNPLRPANEHEQQ